MCRAASLVILNKIDLLPQVDFDVPRAIACTRRINPGIGCPELSAASGQGIKAWCDALRQQVGTGALAEPAR